MPRRSTGGAASTGFVGLPKVVYERSTDPRCSHPNAEPIDTVDGVHVGYLCPDCDEALPAGWTAGGWQRNFFVNSAGVERALSAANDYRPEVRERAITYLTTGATLSELNKEVLGDA